MYAVFPLGENAGEPGTETVVSPVLRVENSRFIRRSGRITTKITVPYVR